MTQFLRTGSATPPSLCSRRNFVAAGASLALPFGLAQAQDNEPIRLGQSLALTGPLGDLGLALQQGALACFSAINAKGGVAGRPIELVSKDDGYDVKRALANVTELQADRSLFALFNCFGTPMVEAMLPQVIESGVPFFAPFTGALVARPKGARNVFNVRASYGDEADKWIQHLVTLGTTKVAVAYQNNAFGKEVFAATRDAMARYKMPAPTGISVENNGSDAADATAKLMATNPEALLLGLAGKPTIDVVKAARGLRKGVPMYALSVMGAAATLKAIGSDATGIAVTQVVPLPTNAIVPVVREFQQAWKASGTTLEASHTALEGYINARIFTEVLSRAGKNPSRAAFVDSAWRLRRLDLGGFEVGFTEPGANASRFVELTMVNRDSRFIR